MNYEERNFAPRSDNENHLRQFDPCQVLRKNTAPAGSNCRWSNKTDEQDYHIIDIKHKINTLQDVPGSIRNFVV